MLHPNGSDPGGEGGSAAFNKLLRALSEQYERDVANAACKTKAVSDVSDLAQNDHHPNSIPNGSAVSVSPVAPKSVWQEPAAKGPTSGHQNAGFDPSAALSVTPQPSQANAVAMEHGQKLLDLKEKEKLEERRSARGTTRAKATARQKTSGVDVIQQDTAVSRFVKSMLFDKLSATLLVANAIFIGIQTQLSFEAQTPVSIDIIDWTFCVLFIVELAVRIWGFGCSHFWCNREDRAWNYFDFTIVLLSSVDTIVSAADVQGDSPLSNISVLRVIRVVRIVRVLRVIRVMKFFQDLRILLSAIYSTLKTASFALMLILIIIYIFGIAITQVVAEHVKEQSLAGTPVPADHDLMFFFGGIFHTMFALFMTIAGGIDWKDAAVPLFEVGVLPIIFFLCYVALMVLCVMNVLLGIFCQCAIDTAASDKENVIQLQLQEKHRFVETLEALFVGWDDSGDHRCSIEEFINHLHDETTQALLRSLEIESRDAIALFELLDTDKSGEVDLGEFVTGCITLRGGAKAVHMEKVQTLSKNVGLQMQVLQEKIDSLEEAFQKQWGGKEVAATQRQSGRGAESAALPEATGLMMSQVTEVSGVIEVKNFGSEAAPGAVPEA